MSGPEPCIAAGREPKHVDVVNSVIRLSDSVESLQRLRDRIVGQDAPPAAKPLDNNSMSYPSLAEVLDKSPQDLREKAMVIDDLVAQIEQTLF